MVLFSVSTPTRLSFFNHDSSRPFELPTPVEFPALDGPVCRTAFSKTGAFAAVTEAGSVYVWEDVNRSSKVVQVVKGLRHDDPISALLLDSHDALTVIFAQGFKVHLHDGRTSQRLTTFENFPSVINDISISSDSQLIATGHESGQACVWNRQHGTHSNITLHPRMPILFAQLHPTRRNLLFLVPRSSPARVIVYDTLKASSPIKTVELAKLSNPSIPTAIAFHPSHSHLAIVTDGGDMWTLNLESWSKRGAEVKVPLTSVGWAEKTTVAMGTETGRLMLRDVRNSDKDGAVFPLSREGDPVLSLSVQPMQVSSASSSRRKAFAESSVGNETATTSASVRDKYESTSAARRAAKQPADLPSITTSASSESRRSQATPVSTSSSSSAYHQSASSAHASSYRSQADDTTPGPAARMSRADSSRTSPDAAPKVKRVLWGDETNLEEDQEPRRHGSESTSRRTVSPPASTSSMTRRASPPRRTSAERLESNATASSSSPTDRVAPSGSSSSYRTSSPRSEGASARRDSDARGGEVLREDSPLIYAMSAQIRDLHLDMLRARRQTKLETKALFKQYFGEMKDLRSENERLRAENERLRRGY